MVTPTQATIRPVQDYSASPFPADIPLSAQAQFHLLVNHIPLYTDEQERELVEVARAGDQAARQALIERTLPYIRAVASRYASMLAHDDFLDLVSEAVVAVIEKMDQALVRAEDPLSYLCNFAKHTIFAYCRAHRSLISNVESRRMDDPFSRVGSLDAPLSDEGDLTLADQIAAPVLIAAPPRDQSELYQALTELTPLQREVIERRYGLFERPAETMAEIAKAHGHNDVYNTEKRAMQRLQTILVEHAPLPKKHNGPWPGQGSRELAERLEQAYTELVTEGVAVSVKKLIARSGVSQQRCSAWLKSHHPDLCSSPQSRAGEQEQKLLAASAELSGAGTPVHVKELAAVAQVSKKQASRWLKKQRVGGEQALTCAESKPEPKPLTQKQLQAKEQRARAREERLAQAYNRLVAEKGSFHYQLLAERAQVRSETARLWLKNRQAQRSTPEQLLASVFPDGLLTENAEALLADRPIVLAGSL
jgi:RNA polymerase sigma factor (sigma-70 family)